MVETPPGLGLAILSAPEPLHYISLFSHSIGYDVVVSQQPPKPFNPLAGGPIRVGFRQLH